MLFKGTEPECNSSVKPCVWVQTFPSWFCSWVAQQLLQFLTWAKQGRSTPSAPVLLWEQPLMFTNFSSGFFPVLMALASRSAISIAAPLGIHHCSFLMPRVSWCFHKQRVEQAVTELLCLGPGCWHPSLSSHCSPEHSWPRLLDTEFFMHMAVISLLPETAGKGRWALSKDKLMLTFAGIMYSLEPLHLWRKWRLLATRVYMQLSAKSEHHLHKSSTWETSWDLWCP